MKVNAKYENGRLSFHSPLTLRHASVEVVVDIPDSEIESVQFDEVTMRMVEKLDAIRNAPLPTEQDDQPSTKLDRLDAFARFRDV